MQERRVQFGFSLDYETSPEEVESVPGMVKEIIQSQQIPVRFDRAHFKSYGENSLDFEVVYFVLDPDFNKYMDIQQDINLRLMQGLRSKGIAFAQPTRIVHVFPTESAEEKPQALGRRGQLPGERAAH
jgi:small-conductance mechanosensitive channel